MTLATSAMVAALRRPPHQLSVLISTTLAVNHQLLLLLLRRPMMASETSATRLLHQRLHRPLRCLLVLILMTLAMGLWMQHQHRSQHRMLVLETSMTAKRKAVLQLMLVLVRPKMTRRFSLVAVTMLQLPMTSAISVTRALPRLQCLRWVMASAISTTRVQRQLRLQQPTSGTSETLVRTLAHLGQVRRMHLRPRSRLVLGMLEL